MAKICKQDNDLADFQLMPKEWETIEHILHLLRPFAELTGYMSSQSYPTLSSIIVYYNAILDHLDNYEEDPFYKQNKHLQIIESAAGAAKIKLLQYYNKTTDIYCVVTLLDPRCNLAFFKKAKFTNDLMKPILKR